MPTLRTRAIKTSALTHDELDANFKRPVTQKTTAYTVLISDNRSVIEGLHASTPFQITMDALATLAAAETGDFEVTITNVGAAAVTVAPASGEALEGVNDATVVLAQYDSVTLTINSDDSGWQTLTKNLQAVAASTVTATSTVIGTTMEPTGDTSAGDNSALGYHADWGAILTGQGTLSDVTLRNDAGSTVFANATGGTEGQFFGVLRTSDLTEATSDTAAALRSAGGLGVAKNIWGGQDLVLDDQTDHTATIAGGMGDIWVKAPTDNGAPNNLIFTDEDAQDTYLNTVTKVKASNETVTSNATVQNDDDLVIALDTDSTYHVKAHLLVNTGASSTPDFLHLFSAPTSSTFDYVMTHSAAPGVPAFIVYTDASTPSSLAVTGSTQANFWVDMTIRTSSTQGNLQFQWAQGTSDGTGTVVQAESWMSARKIR